MRKHLLSISIAVILALLWLRAEVGRRELQHEIDGVYSDRVYCAHVTLRAIDADTNVRLPMELHQVHRLGDKNRKPRWLKGALKAAVDDGGYKFVLDWIGIEGDDIDIEVSSKGYEQIPVTLKAHMQAEVVVPLRRLAERAPLRGDASPGVLDSTRSTTDASPPQKSIDTPRSP